MSAGPAAGDPVPSDYGCYAFTFDVELPGAPEEIYDAITGDISGWWDHSFSENPKRFYVEPKPGGGFLEIFDEEGNGVLHATVLVADRGKLLRMNGPLGLSGQAVDGVYTYRFAAAGENTTLTLEANLAGQITEEVAGIVEGVWRHFLIEQFKPYVESGKHK